MSGIGPDISEVIEELGVTVTILRTPNNLTEKIVYDVNGQASNPFMREHALATSFKYDSAINTGDVLLMGGLYYLVIAKTPDDFEDAVVEYPGQILKCNTNGATFSYETSTQDSNTFEITNGWTNRKTDAHCLIYRGSRGAIQNSDVAEGKETNFRLDCYVPKSYGIQIGDRLTLTNGVVYRVQDIEPYVYPDIDTLSLVDDERVASV